MTETQVLCSLGGHHILRCDCDGDAAAERERLEALADELALVIAKARTGGSVYMDGSHNPLPSERIAARRFMELVAANMPAPALDVEARRALAMIVNETIHPEPDALERIQRLAADAIAAAYAEEVGRE